jgi:hypothetical protein
VARPPRFELGTLCLEDNPKLAISLLFLGSAYFLNHGFWSVSVRVGLKLDPTSIFWNGQFDCFRRSVHSSFVTLGVLISKSTRRTSLSKQYRITDRLMIVKIRAQLRIAIGYPERFILYRLAS